ncbi:head-tail connector protein [Zavarzinia aquatilis]|uniref:head-tail connector protein n=1 Tax=Zavarzinia aquatilis TaxID=2211142 RepID=UPI001402CB81|nr:head-tail connector protein [Zavarzinia aquatilis]
MPIVSLQQAKDHLCVDFDDDDDLIALYIAAAETGLLQYCRIDAVPSGAEAVFQAAALLVVGDLYGYRETVQTGGTSTPIALTPNVLWLVGPHRMLRV